MVVGIRSAKVKSLNIAACFRSSPRIRIGSIKSRQKAVTGIGQRVFPQPAEPLSPQYDLVLTAFLGFLMSPLSPACYKQGNRRRAEPAQKAGGGNRRAWRAKPSLLPTS
jgi:hypothetical protein